VYFSEEKKRERRGEGREGRKEGEERNKGEKERKKEKQTGALVPNRSRKNVVFNKFLQRGEEKT
jgi:hypothetical protein